MDVRGSPFTSYSIGTAVADKAEAKRTPMPSPLSGPSVVCKHWHLADFASDRTEGKASGKIKVPKTEVPGYGSFVLCIDAGDNKFYLGDSKEGAH